MKAEVVFPVLNEARVLQDSVERTLAVLAECPEFDWRITIADNGSTDGTPAIGQELAARHPGVSVLCLPVRGRGLAIRRAWLQSDADILCYQDADLSTDVTRLPDLVRLVAAGADIAIGTRLAPQSRTTRSLRREVVSHGFLAVARVLFPRTRVSDFNCGFKALSRAAVQDLVPRVRNDMWFFDAELLILAFRRGYRVAELPVRWVEAPDSKVRILATAREDLMGLLRMRFGSSRAAPAEHAAPVSHQVDEGSGEAAGDAPVR